MTGNKSVDTIIVGLSTLMSAIVFGVFYYTTQVYQRPLPIEEQERLALLSDSKQVIYADAVKIEKLIVNLRSTSRRLRFLDMEPYIMPFKQYQAAQIEEKKPMIKDIFIDISSQMPPKELNSISGKILLESRLKKEMNRLWEKPIIKEIHFSKFVVQ